MNGTAICNYGGLNYWNVDTDNISLLLCKMIVTGKLKTWPSTCFFFLCSKPDHILTLKIKPWNRIPWMDILVSQDHIIITTQGNALSFWFPFLCNKGNWFYHIINQFPQTPRNKILDVNIIDFIILLISVVLTYCKYLSKIN